MPFGIIGRTGPEMRQVVWFGIGPRKRVLLGANLGRAIVTNGDFTAYVCDSAATRPSSQILWGDLSQVPWIYSVNRPSLLLRKIDRLKAPPLFFVFAQT